MSALNTRRIKATLVGLTACAFLVFAPAPAQAFSLKWLLNPFNAGVSSILNPFHPVYKFNQLTGANPIRFIPGDALIPSERRWIRDPKTDDWKKYSWELEDTVPPIQAVPVITNPVDIVRPPITTPPAPVIVTPSCQRGGSGITPC